MTNLIDTTEMYLRTILELEEEGIPALRARIAERLSHSGPTVSQTIARMERDGLVSVGSDRSLVLSPEGRLVATRVMRKHRIAERLLSEIIGLEYEFVHEEACRWEHVMSERVERKILALLTTSAVSPYGNPIPGLNELGITQHGHPIESFTSLLTAEPDHFQATVDRLGETLQAEPRILADLHRRGVIPGAAITATRHSTGVEVQSGDHEPHLVPADLAAMIFVTLS